MVTYKPLWKILIDREMSQRDLMLQSGISPNTMTKLRHDEEVSLAVLAKICKALNVDYGDIMSYVDKTCDIVCSEDTAKL